MLYFSRKKLQYNVLHFIADADESFSWTLVLGNIVCDRAQCG